MMSNRIATRVLYSIMAALALFGLAQAAQAGGNVNPANQWAWSTNAGWINLTPTNGGGVTVCADHLEGYGWAENVGWIRFGTFTGCGAHTYSNATTADYGVNRSPSGTLTGYAWSTNAGWIKFNPTFGGVTINTAIVSFKGYAWAENFGWIRFNGPGMFLPLLQR